MDDFSWYVCKRLPAIRMNPKAAAADDVKFVEPINVQCLLKMLTLTKTTAVCNSLSIRSTWFLLIDMVRRSTMMEKVKRPKDWQTKEKADTSLRQATGNGDLQKKVSANKMWRDKNKVL